MKSKEKVQLKIMQSKKLTLLIVKGQLISKTNCQPEDSSKKRTNEFVFTTVQSVFVRFLEESSARKKTIRDYLTFNKNKMQKITVRQRFIL